MSGSELAPPEVPEPRAVVIIAVASECGLLALALAIGWFLDRRPLGQIEWTGKGLGYGLIATVPMLAGLFVIVHSPLGPLRALNELVDRMIVPLFRDCTMGQLAVIAILAGAGEELLFRGVAQRGIEQFSGSAWLGLAVASLLFGLAHPMSTTYVVLATVVGVYLGGLLLVTDNLLAPIVAARGL